ncbi:MAG: hypothetical protein GXO15_02660 [Crenarchaeota archaeon]|nr:hypothetical protein [Thermoproteota archaeon]
MSAAVAPGADAPPSPAPQLAVDGEQLARAAAAYAAAASAAAGLEAAEVFYDILAVLVKASDTRYVEGMAEAASRKRLPGHMAAVRGEEFLASLLGFIAAGSCTSTGPEILWEVGEALQADPEAIRMLESLSTDCPSLRHAVALLLLTPPAAGEEAAEP